MTRVLAVLAAIGCASSESAPAPTPARAPAPHPPAPAVSPPAAASDAAPAEPPPDARGLDSGSARPAPEARPAPPRVVRVVPATGGKSAITVDQGTRDGVAVGWRGWLLDRDGDPAPGGDFEVFSVTAGESRALVDMSPEEVRRYPRARLTPP